jgi:hypothetical protein
VWKKRKKGLNKENIAVTVKYPPSVMVWGCVSASGIGNLVEINAKMDAKHYIEIINSNLYASAERMGIRDNFIFQSDNDPKHTSRLAKSWFTENGVEQIEWSPQSQDLNIIENLWDELDRSIPQSDRKSIAGFKKALFKSWEQIGQEVIDRLIRSIPKRLEEVIKANGGNTNY